MGRILVVEDNEALREAIVEVLRDAGHQVRDAASAEDASAGLDDRFPGLLLTDLRLPGRSGLELLREVKGRDPFVEAVVLTAYGTVETAVEAMRAGAFDFLTKPIRMDHLVAKAAQALQVRAERLSLMRETERRRDLEREVREAFNEGRIIGRSAEMQRVYQRIEKVAPTDSSVLITGESGTGKELVARAMHMRSPRNEGPFVRVSCGALPEGVLESELFGHERGAFTGAIKQRRGRFELAHGGALFLDEIAEVGLPVQVRLLRVLQEREFERVGGEETLRVDVRVIAATNRDLEKEVKEGRFREDLYYRLYVIPIHLPPLRDRRADIPLLAEHFVAKICAQMHRVPVKLTADALRVLTQYGWPGNVRELENAMERAIVLCEENTIAEGDLVFLQTRGTAQLPLPVGLPPLNDALAELERALIERALERAGGVKTEAARLLGIKGSALYYKLEKYGLQ